MRALLAVVVAHVAALGLAAEPGKTSGREDVAVTLDVYRIVGAKDIKLSAPETNRWGDAALSSPTGSGLGQFLRTIEEQDRIVSQNSVSFNATRAGEPTPIRCQNVASATQGRRTLGVSCWATVLEPGRTVRVRMQLGVASRGKTSVVLDRTVDTGVEISGSVAAVFRCPIEANSNEEWLVCIRQGVVGSPTIDNLNIAGP